MISFCAKELAIRDDKKVSFETDALIGLDDDDIKCLGNTTGRVEFKLRNNFVIVEGNFKTPLRLKCDRCGGDYDFNLEFDIDEAIEVSDEVLPEELELTADTIHERISSTEEVDIEDYIRQYIILSVPSKKLCSENCVNDKINNSNVSNEEIIDPRWEKLISYKDKIKGE